MLRHPWSAPSRISNVCAIRLAVAALDSSSQMVSTSPISLAGFPRPVVSMMFPPYWLRISRAAAWASAKE